MTTATTGKIRRNSLVIYRGSLAEFRGILFRVIEVEDYYGDTRYSLAYWNADEGPVYRREGERVLKHVRPRSVRRIAAKDIRHRTCGNCGHGPFWVLRSSNRACPSCGSTRPLTAKVDGHRIVWTGLTWEQVAQSVGRPIERSGGTWQDVIAEDGRLIGRVRETPDGWVHLGPQIFPLPTARPCASRRTAVRRLIREHATAGHIN